MKSNFKRLLALILTLCMVLSLSACGDKVTDKEISCNDTGSNNSSTESSDSKDDTKSDAITNDLEMPSMDEAAPEAETPDAGSDVYEESIHDFTASDKSEGFVSESIVGSTTDKGSYDSEPKDTPSEIAPEDILLPEEPGIYEEPSIYEKPEAVSGTLTAGEWNDNKNYDFLLNLISDQGTYASYVSDWKFSLVRKLDVSVVDNNGPVNNTRVTLTDSEGNIVSTAFTDIKGLAYLYVNPKKAAPSKCNVTLNGETKSIELDATSYTKLNEFKFDVETKAEELTKLDLCFVIDTTGSMSDELLYLQAELEDVINTIKKDNELDIRLSVNFYRDEGDEYVTKMYDFSSDIPDMIKKLNEQMCSGGGDYEEAVHTALKEAVNDLSWREDATKLMFFVLDAPAHRENPEVVDSLLASITTATEKGIRIIPIASSGVNKHTEFMLRGFSAITNGTYIFLTDHSGVGESHIEPSIGDYEVEKLNSLLIRVITERIRIVATNNTQ